MYTITLLIMDMLVHHTVIIAISNTSNIKHTYLESCQYYSLVELIALSIMST